MKNKFLWLQIAKGIGILLVVVGHFDPRVSPGYWTAINLIIYSFHMPLFFVLSGYLYTHGKYSYPDLIKNKSRRLLLPFVTIAGIFFLIKYVAGKIVHLEYPVGINSVYSLLIDPTRSYMPPLWFIYALFLIFALYPLARLFLSNLSLLILSIALLSFLGSDILIVGTALANMPFFIFGVMVRENTKTSNRIIGAGWKRIAAPALTFIFIYGGRVLFDLAPLSSYFFTFVLGISGTLFVINVSQAVSAAKADKLKEALLQLGDYSMSIYLFHTLFEGTVRIVLLQGILPIQPPFEIVAFIAILCGVFFPLELEKRILKRYRLTRRFVLGLT